MDSQISCRSVAFSEEKDEDGDRDRNGELDREGDRDRARLISAHRRTGMIVGWDIDLIGEELVAVQLEEALVLCAGRGRAGTTLWRRRRNHW